MTRKFKHNLVNFAFFQSAWLACVLGAAHGVLSPAVLLTTVFIVWQLHPNNRANGDIQLVLVCCTIGFVLDTLWVQLGVIEYMTAVPFEGFAPIWILFLWVSLALALNHSLAWLKNNLLWPVLFGAFGSPLSYYAGARLGAAFLPLDVMITVSAFGISWALVMLFLVVLSLRLTEPGREINKAV